MNNDRFKKFMQGRYGADEFLQFLLVVAVAFIILDSVFRVDLFALLAVAALAYAAFRALSKNPEARMRENVKYLEMYDKVKGSANAATVKRTSGMPNTKPVEPLNKAMAYFYCEGCGAKLSVPKGKGRVRIVCPRCRKEMFRNS